MDGTVKDLIKVCEENKLMDIELYTEWLDGLCWSIYLDENHDVEIQYTWHYKDRSMVVEKLVWYHDDDCNYDRTVISTEEALKLRGLE